MSETKFPELAFAKAVKKAEVLNVPKSILIYGDPKNGKTWLAASASEVPELSPVLLIDVEGGASAIARDWKDVDVLAVDNHQQLDAAVEQLLTQPHGYKTIIIDTLGVAMDRAEKVFEEKVENVKNPFGKWGDLKEWANNMARNLHHAPFLTIFVAHAMDEKDQTTGAVKTVPMLPGSMRSTLPAIPDIIGYMSSERNDETIKRAVYLQGSDRLVSGNRFGLPARMQDPSLKKILDTIKKIGEAKK
jgi:hypothetical protein